MSFRVATCSTESAVQVRVAARRTLHWCIGRCQQWCNMRNAIQACCRGVSVLLDVTMLAQQAHCDTLRCNSFSLLQRWNRARRNTLECCQGNLCATTMWRQARLHAIRCNGLHLHITFSNGCIKVCSFAMGFMERSRQVRCNMVYCGTVSMLQLVFFVAR
jgi:hypothetical protein